MKNRILPLLAVAMLAAGCAKNNEPGAPQGDAVRFSASITQTPGGNQTRTTGGGDSWVAGDKVGVFMLAAGGTDAGAAIESNHPYTASAAGVLTPDGDPMYYPQNGNTVDFTAYYPYNAAASSGTLDLTVAGQTDETAQNALDVLWARTPGKRQGSPTVGLAFGHVLSKVTFNITLSDGSAATAVTLTGMPLTASLDLADGTLTPGATGNIAAQKVSAAPSGFAASFTAIIVPQQGGAGRTARFTVGGSTYTWDIPAAESWEAGRHYVYPVTVNLTGVSVGAASIADWNTRDHSTGSGTATEYTVIGSATFTDGTAGQLYGRKIDEDPSGDTYEMVFNGGGSKTVYSVTIGSKTHLIRHPKDSHRHLRRVKPGSRRPRRRLHSGGRHRPDGRRGGRCAELYADRHFLRPFHRQLRRRRPHDCKSGHRQPRRQ